MWKEKFSKALANVESGKNGEKTPKRKIENLVVFVIIVIICILVVNSMWNTQDNKKNTEITETAGRKLAQTESTKQETTSQEDTIAANLEAILAKIQRSRKSKSNDYLFTNKQHYSNV